MSAEQVRNRTPLGQIPTTAELVDRLSRFEGPPEQFLVNLLAVQCHLAAASAAAMLRPGAEGQPEVVSVFPPLPTGGTAPVWLAHGAQLAGQVAQGGATAIMPLQEPDSLYGQPADRHLIMIPLTRGQGVRGVAVYVIEARTPGELTAARERLELSISLLSLYEMRLAMQRRSVDLRRLRVAMDTLSAVNETDRFAGSGMSLCNELASRWQCERVSLGFLKGRYVHLKALSHTEKFSRKMVLVQDLESAMEECLDQDVEVVYPSGPEATFVSRVAAELARKHGPASIVAMPIRRGGEPVGVLLAERRADTPMTAEELETLRLTVDLCTPRLVDLYEHDRWVGARLARSVRKGLAAAVGPRHTWWKVAAVAVCLAVIVLAFGHGKYRAEGSFVFQAAERQVLPAPFDGYIEDVLVEDKDPVVKGQTVLATLRTDELKMQLGKAYADLGDSQAEADLARRDGKFSEAQAADAKVRGAQFNIQQLQRRIEQARIVATRTGVVVEDNDLKRRIGKSVKMGEPLFHIADLSDLQAELAVPEDEIAGVRDGTRPAADGKGMETPSVGELASTTYPDRKIPFTVERINPVAELVDNKNVFKVRVRLHHNAEWMRPGMSGVAKVDLGIRSYAYLISRKMINWLRMKLWL
ncbi:MAG TPA: HlyD family efflux transporter periplasmic adaptor subunit [Phycisphaerae bacterium]|nr:HlyD family efflux transporter periplasmic adaptor subunit [Phycisphaerae bacterium]